MPHEICTRPDCDWLGEKENSDYNFKIVGRVITKHKDSEDKNTMWWLIKWDKYVN